MRINKMRNTSTFIYIVIVEDTRRDASRPLSSYMGVSAQSSIEKAKAYADAFQGGFPRGQEWMHITNMWWTDTGLYHFTIEKQKLDAEVR